MKKIYLNRIYVLDIGNENHDLVMVRVLKIVKDTIHCSRIKDEKIPCYHDFIHFVPYKLFKQNGYSK